MFYDEIDTEVFFCSVVRSYEYVFGQIIRHPVSLVESITLKVVFRCLSSLVFCSGFSFSGWTSDW